MSTDYTIYHNPRCTKSRQTLQLLRDHGVEPTIVEYLKDGPSVKTLKAILKSLGVSADQLIRRKEKLFVEVGEADVTYSENDAIALLVKYPRLLERPIVVRSGRAVIGRPPENVLELL